MADEHKTHELHHDADGHGHGPPGADLAAVQQGHEDDKFGVRVILYVPLLVVIALTFAYVLVSSIIGIAYQSDRMTPYKNAALAERNELPLNERFERISSTNVKAPVKQPRLEYLKVEEQTDENVLTAPAFVRSKVPTAENNSPEYRPESLWPQNFVDPMTGKKVLIEYHAIEADGKKLAQIPIATAMKLVVEQNLLPVSKKPVKVSLTTADAAKLSNGGLGVVPAAADFGHKDHDHDDKPVEKKNEPEPKEPEKKEPAKKESDSKEPEKKEPEPKKDEKK